MEQMHPAPNMPHIVQVYSSVSSAKMQNPQVIHLSHPPLSVTHDKLTYQQATTSEPLRISVSEEQPPVQSQIVMSCQQTHLTNLQPVTMPSQVLQTDITQSLQSQLQFTPHMILPQGSLTQMLIDGTHSFFGQYSYLKEQNLSTKVEAEQSSTEQTIEEQTEQPQSDTLIPEQARRKRRTVADKSLWACNVRKLRHQTGEAYVSRRGKFVPKRQIKTNKNCLTSCKMKCNSKITDDDRELIFKAFYSLKRNEKKFFLLNTTERHDVKRRRGENNNRRQHTFKYYFLVRGHKHAVCKDFYLGTLAISQKPVYNVHSGKSEMNIPKPDGRGLSASSIHSLPADLKESVRNHISSFKTKDSLPIKQFSKNKQHLDVVYNIKQMYLMYVSDCQTKNITPVKQSMYRKIFKEEFNVQFARDQSADRLCAKCKEPIKK